MQFKKKNIYFNNRVNNFDYNSILDSNSFTIEKMSMMTQCQVCIPSENVHFIRKSDCKVNVAITYV